MGGVGLHGKCQSLLSRAIPGGLAMSKLGGRRILLTGGLGMWSSAGSSDDSVSPVNALC